MKAPINKIIDLSIVDGVGCRTSIFFQNCNVFCKYCHNPETRNMCINCMDCISVCPVDALENTLGKVEWHMDKCIDCNACIRKCTYSSSPKFKYLSVDEVLDRIKSNIPFIRGITTSGGECTLYSDFLISLFKKTSKLGLTNLVDTNGFTPLFDKKELLNTADGFMIDVKAWDGKNCINLIGKDNKVVKENLRLLYDINKIEEIRIVCLDEFMDVIGTIEGIYKHLDENVKKITLKIIPFSNVGVVGELKDYKSPSMEEIKGYIDYGKNLGFNVITS